MTCQQPRVVDCNGDVIPVETDELGNEILRLCPQSLRPKFIEWDSLNPDDPDNPGPPDPSECCVPGTDSDGNYAVDLAFGAPGCVSHICRNGQWLPLCGQMTPGSAPDELVCYDLASLPFPVTYGGAGSSWLVGGVDRLNDDVCDPDPGGGTGTPQIVEYTCEYSNSACNNAPPDVASLNWTPNPAADPLAVEATGDPADGWPCTRPTFRVDFGLPAGSSGPYSVSFDLTVGGGCLNAMLYDRCNDEFLPIVSHTGPNSFVGSSTLGDLLVINSMGGTGSYSIQFADPNNVDGSCLEMIFTAVGAFPNSADPLEQILNVELAHTEPMTGGASDCCATAGTPAIIAALLTADDPFGNVWTVDGDSICTTVPPGQGAVYQTLEVCEGTVDPTVTPAP